MASHWSKFLHTVACFSLLCSGYNAEEGKSNSVLHIAEPRNAHILSKRALPASQMSQQQVQNSVDAHNKHRKEEGASDMKYMLWNNNLASMAQSWAEGCLFEHGQPVENPSGYSSVGQNLYFTTTPSFDETAAVLAWFNEKPDYNYDDTSCPSDKMCGHYTQVVWAETFEVGCGLHLCPVLSQNSGSSYNNAWNWVCNYGPAGNFIGEKPYKKGPGCTECSSGQFHCFEESLCRSNLECGTAGVDCPCNGQAACQNCANVTDACGCTCMDGYSGVSCLDKCENFDDQCGGNPGWPARWCNDAQYPFVSEKCPLLCDLCKPPRDGVVCQTSSSAGKTWTSSVSLLAVMTATSTSIGLLIV